MSDNVVVSLKKQGLNAAGSTGLAVDPRQIFIPPPGHPLFDARSLDAFDEQMVQDILAGKFKPVVGVRNDGMDPKAGLPRLTLVYGNGRTLAGCEVVARQIKAGVSEDKLFRIGVQILKGTDKEMFAEKIKENGGRRDETPQTLRAKFESYMSIDPDSAATLAECAALYRIDLKTAEAVMRESELPKEIREKFAKRQLPLTAIGGFFAVVPEERENLLRTIETSGAKTPSEITAVVKKETAKVARQATKVRKANGTVRPYAMPAPIVLRVCENLKKDGTQKALLARAIMLYQRGDKKVLRQLDEALFDKMEAAQVAEGKKDKAARTAKSGQKKAEVQA